MSTSDLRIYIAVLLQFGQYGARAQISEDRFAFVRAKGRECTAQWGRTCVGTGHWFLKYFVLVTSTGNCPGDKREESATYVSGTSANRRSQSSPNAKSGMYVVELS